MAMHLMGSLITCSGGGRSKAGLDGLGPGCYEMADCGSGNGCFGAFALKTFYRGGAIPS
jgi:hypothetical protein